MNADIMHRAAAVRLAIFDVDGVLTDGQLYIGHDGMETKAVSVRDGHGIKRLHHHGVSTAVISGRKSAAMSHRLTELGVQYVHLGVDDKMPVFETLLKSLQLTHDQCAYMGDDEPDLGVMRRVGLSLAVADAEDCAREAAHWISARPGGQGGVRDACDLILGAQGKG